jgi:eukaryotic-like serine/threonine-protein kinase
MIADPDEGQPETATGGTQLIAGRYRLISAVGGGSMGVVWRARDEKLGRDVAVKELRPDTTMSGAEVRQSHLRARREGRIAARLQHPNAVTVYDVAEHDGRPYLIMEFVPSSGLGEILSTGTVLPPAEVGRIGAQLASALAAAHAVGIVHRDIKPGNVLMTASGGVKLTDFGISRATGDATVTATGEILGTPAYTAPEVAHGHDADFPADVFSLGSTLYAAVEGTPPFGDEVNAMAVLLRVVHNEIRPPRRSGVLTDTLMRMLSPEPADRPTMKEVGETLRALSASPPPVVEVPLAVADSVEAEAPAAEPVPVPVPVSLPAPTPTATLPETPPPAAGPEAAVVAEGTTSMPEASATEPSLPRVRSRKPLMLAGGVASLAVAIAAGVVLSSGGGHPATSPAAHPGATAAATTTPKKTPTSAKPATSGSATPSVSATKPSSSSTTPSASTTTGSSSNSDVAAQLASTITTYYNLVPGNLSQAWTYLTPDYQQNKALGYDNYKSFWQGMQRINVSNVVAKAPDTVVITIDYYPKSGRPSEERTSFTLVQQGGSWKIAHSTVLSSKSIS